MCSYAQNMAGGDATTSEHHFEFDFDSFADGDLFLGSAGDGPPSADTFRKDSTKAAAGGYDDTNTKWSQSSAWQQDDGYDKATGSGDILLSWYRIKKAYTRVHRVDANNDLPPFGVVSWEGRLDPDRDFGFPWYGFSASYTSVGSGANIHWFYNFSPAARKPTYRLKLGKKRMGLPLFCNMRAHFSADPAGWECPMGVASVFILGNTDRYWELAGADGSLFGTTDVVCTAHARNMETCFHGGTVSEHRPEALDPYYMYYANTESTIAGDGKLQNPDQLLYTQRSYSNAITREEGDCHYGDMHWGYGWNNDNTSLHLISSYMWDGGGDDGPYTFTRVMTYPTHSFPTISVIDKVTPSKKEPGAGAMPGNNP